MGNSSSNYSTIPQNIDTNVNNTNDCTNAEIITNIGDTNTSNVCPVNNIIKKQPPYVLPFIAMINEGKSQIEMINTLQAFCGKNQIGVDEKNEPIYYIVDQMEFKAPVMQLFSYCANNGKDSVVKWLVDNYVPLEVSYDNNFCYYECLKWKYNNINDMIVCHESFNPTMEILENLLERNKFSHFKHCMNSPYLRGDMQTYRFTFMNYVDNNQYLNIKNLLEKIKQRLSNPNIQIMDYIQSNPKLDEKEKQFTKNINIDTDIITVPKITDPTIIGDNLNDINNLSNLNLSIQTQDENLNNLSNLSLSTQDQDDNLSNSGPSIQDQNENLNNIDNLSNLGLSIQDQNENLNNINNLSNLGLSIQDQNKNLTNVMDNQISNNNTDTN